MPHALHALHPTLHGSFFKSQDIFSSFSPSPRPSSLPSLPFLSTPRASVMNTRVKIHSLGDEKGLERRTSTLSHSDGHAALLNASPTYLPICLTCRPSSTYLIWTIGDLTPLLHPRDPPGHTFSPVCQIPLLMQQILW